MAFISLFHKNFKKGYIYKNVNIITLIIDDFIVLFNFRILKSKGYFRPFTYFLNVDLMVILLKTAVKIILRIMRSKSLKRKLSPLYKLLGVEYNINKFRFRLANAAETAFFTGFRPGFPSGSVLWGSMRKSLIKTVIHVGFIRLRCSCFLFF